MKGPKEPSALEPQGPNLDMFRLVQSLDLATNELHHKDELIRRLTAEVELLQSHLAANIDSLEKRSVPLHTASVKKKPAMAAKTLPRGWNQRAPLARKPPPPPKSGAKAS